MVSSSDTLCYSIILFVTPSSLVGNAHHVLDGNAALGARALDLGEIHAHLVCLLLGGVRGIRLLTALLASSSLLPLLRRLISGVLRLLDRSSGNFLGLSRYLSGLIGCLTRCLACGVLYALGYLTDLIGDSSQRSSATLLAAAGEPAYGFLGLTCHLPGLIRGLPGYLLGLTRCLACGVLCLLGCLLGELLCLLGGGLCGLVHHVLDALVLGRSIHRALDFHVGVDHLLDQGLRIPIGSPLIVTLELLPVVLDLALDPAQRLPKEALSLLQVLLILCLLSVLRLVRHSLSYLLVDFYFDQAVGLSGINPTDIATSLLRRYRSPPARPPPPSSSSPPPPVRPPTTGRPSVTPPTVSWT